MCHISVRHSVPFNAPCECDCNCLDLLSVEEEINMLEEHKKYMKDRIDTIEKKISALRTVKES
jgi:hypothetical protein